METPDPNRMHAEMYEAWEKAMGQWWDQVLDSPAFVKGMGEGLGAQAKARSTYEQHIDKSMEAMHLPTRNDLVRVAKICSLLEDRLLTLEDSLLELEDARIAAEKAALQARIEAAEARLAQTEALDAITAKLDALLAAQVASKPARTRKKATKTPKTDS
ncbi:MAG: hypothetical protein GY913_03285 [Proteobacteria bacterium]|nr:hypothetical protein [Pseudomonadota bacterium]MCP4915924.1 hypothetical protein [Pseudomonadota bacterium]